LKSLIRLPRQNRFIKNILIVASGAAGAQAIALIFMPFITRIYGPESFGILGSFNAILAIIIHIASLSLPLAIVLPKSDNEAAGIAKISIRIALGISVCAGLVFWIFDDFVSEYLKVGGFDWLFILFPIVMFSSAVTSVSNQWLIRVKLYSIRSKMVVIHSFLANSGKLGAGIISPVAHVLLVATALAAVIQALLLWLAFKRYKFVDLDSTLKIKDLKYLFFKYQDFAKYRTPQIVVNTFGQSAPVLILIALYNPVIAGFYTLARSVVDIPSRLIAESVADVFFQRFAEVVKGGGSGKKLFVRSCMSLFAVGLIPYSVVFLFGSNIFTIIFGAEWAQAGNYAGWLSLWLLAVLAARPAVAAIPVLLLQKQFFIYECLSTFFKLLFMLIAHKWIEGAQGVVIVFSLVSAMSQVLLAIYVYAKL
jgi:O-antigen/teichoic acid export membrane protein